MEYLNFAECEKKAKNMSIESLEYSIKDCTQAYEAYPDGQKSGYYLDERSVYSKELNARKNQIKKETTKEKALGIASLQRQLILKYIGDGTNLYNNSIKLIELINEL